MLTIAGGIILAVLILALIPVIIGAGIGLGELILRSPVLLVGLGIGVLSLGIYIVALAERGPIRAAIALGLAYCVYKIWRALERTRG